MKTVARLSAEDRSDLFRNTANRMQMSDAIVEKDFWVCFMKPLKPRPMIANNN